MGWLFANKAARRAIAIARDYKRFGNGGADGWCSGKLRVIWVGVIVAGGGGGANGVG